MQNGPAGVWQGRSISAEPERLVVLDSGTGHDGLDVLFGDDRDALTFSRQIEGKQPPVQRACCSCKAGIL